VTNIMTKRTHLFSLALLAAIIVGLVLGSAFPHRVEAASFFEFWHDVPVGGTTGQSVGVTCGWHNNSGCGTTNVGIAVDFLPVGSGAYFAGAAKRSSSTGSG